MTLTLICFATAKKKSFLSSICLFVLVNVKIDLNYVGYGFFYDGVLGSVIHLIVFPTGSVKPLEIRLLKYFC